MLTEELRQQIKETGLTKEDLKIILLDNFTRNYKKGKRFLDLTSLNFSDFDGDIAIAWMKVKGNLFQSNQTVGETLYQHSQKVGCELWQYDQEVKENLYQKDQKVQGNLYSDESKIEGK
ncbi:hypothetical protein [Mammaliicoccus vitulinus]|uniref:hypothetical protein n=1 Tax=Mammaliicoccus vitulinus TaxID=71237 RepID=UPI00248CD6FE|nr:hypothetical protein [Mammaliicoccus vitulinus]